LQLPMYARPLGYAALLVLVALIGYANSFHVPFTLDDEPSILSNPLTKPPLTIAKVLGSDRPVVNLTLAINYGAARMRVFGYHALNLAAHILCGLVFYGFARYTLRLPVLRAHYGGASDGLAAAAAAIFVLHPIQTESVTYIVQRAEIFAAAALIGGVWIAAVAAQRTRAYLYAPAVAVVGLLGFWSKDSTVVLPVLFALYDWCFIAHGEWRPFLRRWPFYLLLALSMGAAVGWRWWQATHLGGGVALGGVDLSGLDLPPIVPDVTPRESITPWVYLQSQFGVWLYYLRLIAVPNRLCFDCGYLGAWPVRSSLLGEMVWLPAAALAAIAVAAWWVRWRAPLVPFCLFASAIVLAPSSSVVPLADAYFEHRLYLPIAFLSLLVVTTAFSASQAMVRRGWLSSSAAGMGRVVVACSVAAVLATLTLARNHVYADPLRLLQDTVAKAPKSARARYNLANEYGKRGQHEQAIAEYRAVIEEDPGPFPYYINLGRQYLKVDKIPEAVETFEQARERAPNQAIVYRNLVVAYSRAGRIADSVAAGERACALEPLHPGGNKLLAAAYAQAGRLDDALKRYLWVLRLRPQDTQARDASAQLARRLGVTLPPNPPATP
jgi:tetratricopeptide (TPR) repeat protein